MAQKERLDVLLIEQGFFLTREKAKGSIMAGLVFVNQERVDKPGTKVPRDAHLFVKGTEHPYVSRGGLKLERAIKVFNLDLQDAIVVDVGASTGGFTDCSLQNGASYVYAVDVGTNQLAWKLRQDDRVKVMEQYHFRHANPADFTMPIPSIAVIDVSFISLHWMWPPLSQIICDGGQAMALVKPQFEAGRELVGKKGLVRDPQVHKNVIAHVIQDAALNGWNSKQLTHSPITGGDGNIEFLLHLCKDGQAVNLQMWNERIEQVVNEAHEILIVK